MAHGLSLLEDARSRRNSHAGEIFMWITPASWIGVIVQASSTITCTLVAVNCSLGMSVIPQHVMWASGLGHVRVKVEHQDGSPALFMVCGNASAQDSVAELHKRYAHLVEQGVLSDGTTELFKRHI